MVHLGGRLQDRDHWCCFATATTQLQQQVKQEWGMSTCVEYAWKSRFIMQFWLRCML